MNSELLFYDLFLSQMLYSKYINLMVTSKFNIKYNIIRENYIIYSYKKYVCNKVIISNYLCLTLCSLQFYDELKKLANDNTKQKEKVMKLNGHIIVVLYKVKDYMIQVSYVLLNETWCGIK